MLDGYIKAMCVKLAELALEKVNITVSISSFNLTFTHHRHDEDGGITWIYYDNIFFIDEDTEQRIEKALDYVRNLGGRKDGELH